MMDDGRCEVALVEQELQIGDRRVSMRGLADIIRRIHGTLDGRRAAVPLNGFAWTDWTKWIAKEAQQGMKGSRSGVNI